MLKVIYKHPGAVIGAVILHVLLGGLFFLSFDWTEKPDLAVAGIPVALITEGSLETQANNVSEEPSNKPTEKQILKEKQEAKKAAEAIKATEANKKIEEQKQREQQEKAELRKKEKAEELKLQAVVAAAQALKLKKRS